MIHAIEQFRMKRHLKRGYYNKAAGILEPKARAGNVEAAFKMGLIYVEAWDSVGGEYVFQAEKWLAYAAEQGHAQAQYMLGDLYATDAYRPERLQRAVRWYRKAKRNGVFEAGRQLAMLHFRYRHMIEEDINAIGLLTEAADHGDYKAILLLAWGYKKGRLSMSVDYARYQYWWYKLKDLSKKTGS